MAKTNEEMLKKLLAQYKEQLAKEQQLLEEHKTILKEWDNQVENGSECIETGKAVIETYNAFELARADGNLLARLALEYVMKIQKEENTSE